MDRNVAVIAQLAAILFHVAAEGVQALVRRVVGQVNARRSRHHCVARIRCTVLLVGRAFDCTCSALAQEVRCDPLFFCFFDFLVMQYIDGVKQHCYSIYCSDR